jgi:holo-[acyl-carrier protein] synthase
LERVFHPHELDNGRPERLAGIFAAKEALFKALGKKEDWLMISIMYEKDTGKPVLESPLLAGRHASVSISHDGDYAIAAVIIT